MDKAEMMLRSFQDQGLIERVDLEDTGGDPAEIVKNVLARLRNETEDWFLAHPTYPSNLLPGETDPGDRPAYTPQQTK